MAFEKLKKLKDKFMIGRVEQLWDEGYNSLEIAIKMHIPVERVQEYVKVIVAREKTAK